MSQKRSKAESLILLKIPGRRRFSLSIKQKHFQRTGHKSLKISPLFISQNRFYLFKMPVGSIQFYLAQVLAPEGE